ncbi:zinc-dependent metalloprotease [Pedobacter fastidiosus]|nr:zinc-dependent metalloprotease [Pedobacter fastidiosus]
MIFLITTLPASAQQEKLAGQLVSFNKLISSGAKISRGFFTTYHQNDKFYFEIPDSMLGRDIVVVNRVVKAVAETIVTGDQLNDQKVIRFDKSVKNKLILYAPSYKSVPKDTSSGIYSAISRSNLPAIITTFDVKAYTQNLHGSVIDVTAFITNNELFGGADSLITSVKAFSDNIEIQALKTNSSEVNTSLLLLPKVPMQARYFDDRIGYFNTSAINFEVNGINEVKLIRRRRLEPKAEDWDKYKHGELVEPKKPIVFYIDPATPKKWIPYLIQGVNDWQPVLEKAGFKNAIFGKIAPTPLEDSTWSLQDAAHSAIVYKPSTGDVNAPNIYDPRSGELLESHINWAHGIMKVIHDTYFIQAAVNDPKARHMNFDDELMGQLIRVIISHEIGHTLGLLHNMGASSTVPVEKLRDKVYVEEHGHTPSIMDYSRFNYVAQPEDGITGKDLFPRIGDYDQWAIEWGYRLFPQFKTPAEEQNYLAEWASEKLKNPSLIYLKGDDSNENDPRAQKEDLGDNAMKAGEYGIKNLQRLVPNLINWTKEPNKNFTDLTNMYHEIIGYTPNGNPFGQYVNYIEHVLKNIGGIYNTPRVANDTIAVYQYVPKMKQKEAVAFLNKYLFATPYWLLDKDVLARTGDNPLLIVGTLQNVMFNKLINTKLDLTFRAEASLGDEAYTANELLNDLKLGIWSELINNKPITIYRRSLQKTYIYFLTSMLGNPQYSKDLSCIARENLEILRKDISIAIPKTTNQSSKAHLNEVARRIDKALKIN